MRVGFYGLGSMGVPMARNIMRAGMDLVVYNRTPSKAAPLVEEGAKLATSVDEFSDVEILCTMLSDDTTIEGVCLSDGELSLQLSVDAVHLSHSTISPGCVARLVKAHQAKGVHLVTAPVLGRPDKAEQGALSVILSGPEPATKKCQSVLEAISARVFDMGSDPTMASFAKLGMNYMLACAVESMAETFAMTRKAGIQPDAFLELVTETIFGAPVYNGYGPLVAHEVLEESGFRTILSLKDVSLAVEAAGSIGAELPMSEPIRNQMKIAIDSGYADKDWVSLAIIAARAAGLPPISKSEV